MPATPHPRQPVITDVARLAGVSHQTVSRVLNDHPSVRAETRARVNEAIAQLGYRPNRAARALVTKRSDIIGVVSTQAEHYGPRSMLLGVEEAARDADLSVFIQTLGTAPAAVMTDRLNVLIDHFIDEGVDGIVVIAPLARTSAALRGLRASRPVLVLGDDDAGSVSVDQRLGARLATRHLLGLGHRTVAHLSGPLEWYDADARRKGWLEELHASRAVVSADAAGDWTPASGYRATGWAVDTGATAVFAANDQMALGLTLGLAQAGLRVPEDVSVVGFDDIPEAEYFLPPLTTIRQDFAELGRRGVASLLRRMDHPAATDAGSSTAIEPELVVRASTSAPR